MKYIKTYESFEESLKQRLTNYYTQEADYNEEEIQNVLEILDEYDDELTNLKGYNKVLLLRLIDDHDLYEEVDSIGKDVNDMDNLFDE
jgi:tRNA (Thr-GGU) A37 N-methylase